MTRAREAYRRFIDSCRAEPGNYRLTPNAEPTVYATCFAVFGLHLLGETIGGGSRAAITCSLRAAVREERKLRPRAAQDKPYRQLLAFVLSALRVLEVIEEDPLAELVREQIEGDVEEQLAAAGALAGKAQSGNQAMFTAAFLLHAERYLGIDTRPALRRWVELHLQHMNRFGFWGAESGMTHLAFQNGYHQYEIFEYLGVRPSKEREALAAVRTLADAEGHFAPYPGGGSCYDYDAVFLLTSPGREPDESTAAVLRRTAQTILSEQTPEGGFAESRRVRPRSWANLARAARHTAASWGDWPLFRERLRYNVTLQRTKHNRIHTHWSRYSRRWDEPNLWDSWFRMLTLARIESAFEPQRAREWGFIDYPGIGFHHSLRERTLVAA